jgi:hypothetical protein
VIYVIYAFSIDEVFLNFSKVCSGAHFGGRVHLKKKINHLTGWRLLLFQDLRVPCLPNMSEQSEGDVSSDLIRELQFGCQNPWFLVGTIKGSDA